MRIPRVIRRASRPIDDELRYPERPPPPDRPPPPPAMVIFERWLRAHVNRDWVEARAALKELERLAGRETDDG